MMMDGNDSLHNAVVCGWRAENARGLNGSSVRCSICDLRPNMRFQRRYPSAHSVTFSNKSFTRVANSQPARVVRSGNVPGNAGIKACFVEEETILPVDQSE